MGLFDKVLQFFKDEKTQEPEKKPLKRDSNTKTEEFEEEDLAPEKVAAQEKSAPKVELASQENAESAIPGKTHEEPLQPAKVKQAAATKGSIDDVFNEAMICYEGEGVEKDLNKARRLFAQGSMEGHVPSKVMLGVCYMLGQGIAQNRAVARKLFGEAAEAGNAVGMRFLANAILESEPKQEEMEQVVDLYEKSANIGDPVSCEWIADCYYIGKMRARNVGKALEFYEKAANAGNLKAEYKIANHIIQYDEKKIPNAVKMLEHLVEVGYSDAFYALGTLYYTGTGMPENFEKGAELIKKAADMGDPRAQDLLGVWCYDGELFNPDYPSALHWFEDAAQKNYAPAQVHLGKMYLEGKGVKQNIFEAAELFYRAGMDGYVEGMLYLMKCYREHYVPVYGDGKNGTDMEWLQKAASFNFQVPLFQFGMAYLEGKGVAKDIDKAMELLIVSAMLGYGDAMYVAGVLLLKGEIVPQDLQQAYIFLEQAANGDIEGKVNPEAAKLVAQMKAGK